MPRPADLQADPGLPQVTVRCDPCNDLVLFDRYLSCPGASRQSGRDGPVDLQLVWVPEGGRPTAPTPRHRIPSLRSAGEHGVRCHVGAALALPGAQGEWQQLSRKGGSRAIVRVV